MITIQNGTAWLGRTEPVTRGFNRADQVLVEELSMYQPICVTRASAECSVMLRYPSPTGRQLLYVFVVKTLNYAKNGFKLGPCSSSLQDLQCIHGPVKLG